MPSEYFFADHSSMMGALQSSMCVQLQQDLQQRAQVSLFLSGGSTPAPLYHALAESHLPWERVHVALVDERFVPVNDVASNEKLLREHLLHGPAAAAEFTGMSVAAFNERQELSLMVQACNTKYAQLPHPYSAALLGMGADGHTASLFPHAEGLEDGLGKQQHCVAIRAKPSPVTGALTQRISMTLWALLQCRKLYLLFTGEQKKAVYEQAKITSDHHALPIAAVLQQQDVAVEVYWCP